MEFDKTRVFTFYDADEVGIGSKGHFANSHQEMMGKITAECPTDTLEEILDESFVSRFKADDGKVYTLFYLVDKPEEGTCHPYKNTDEMINDFMARSGFDGNSNPMYNPLIWLKDCEGTKYLISSFTKNYVYIPASKKYFGMDSLIKEFTYLDGTPCGKKI